MGRRSKNNNCKFAVESLPPEEEEVFKDTVVGNEGNEEKNKTTNEDNNEGKAKEENAVGENAIKHPLEYTWSLWLFADIANKNWKQNQIEMTTFNTVEDFWCLYHHLKQPSELKCGQDYSIFKLGISPMWEDERNRHGGRWMINLFRIPDIDRIWLDTVLLMIGESFESSNIICGAVVNVRGANKKDHKISIWTNSTEEKGVLEIGRKLKGHFKINCNIHFYQHKGVKLLYTL